MLFVYNDPGNQVGADEMRSHLLYEWWKAHQMRNYDFGPHRGGQTKELKVLLHLRIFRLYPFRLNLNRP